jgi:hypothetical protein
MMDGGAYGGDMVKCVCGREFAKAFGRNIHGRTCPIERARSEAFCKAIEDGRTSPAEIRIAEAAAVRAALTEQASRA